MIIVPDHGNQRGVSKPRSIVRLDGHDVWFNSWTVNLNSTSEADDFTLELPFGIMRNQPQSYLVNTPDHASLLMEKADIKVEIYVGYPQNAEQFTDSELTRLMYGYVDTIEITCNDQGELVTLSGRNLVARLLDNKVTDKYQNMTASAIVDKIAKKRNMKSKISSTYTLVGVNANDDSVEMSSDQSEWDFLLSLAEQEGFSLRVSDDTLYFGEFDEVIGMVSAGEPLAYTWGQNIEAFTLTRAPHATKTVVVDVHSYQQSSSLHILASAKQEYANSTDTYHEHYFFTGLTQAQAQKKANSLLGQLSRLEKTGTMSVAGNEHIKVDRRIGLYGVGAGISDFYYVRQASHNFDYSSGYTTDITFSNISIT